MMGFTPKCTTGRSAEIWGSPHTSPSAFLQQPCFIPTVWTRVTVRTPNLMTGHPRGWSSPCPSASTAKSTKPFTYVRQNFTPSARLSIFHLPLPPPFFFAPSFSLFCPLQPQSQPFRGIDSVSLACFCFFFSGISKHPCWGRGSWRGARSSGTAVGRGVDEFRCALSHLPPLF